MNILGYTIYTSYPQLSFRGRTIINTLNPHSYCVAKKDVVFREALQQADILIPDGIGIVLAAKLIHGQKIKRITGADMHQYLLEEAQKSGLKVFYMGAHSTTLQKVETRVKEEYPSVKVASYSPPYRDEFSIEESNQMIDAINNFSPDILFVGMTAPKQEKWVHQYKNRIDARVICSIGAVFGFFARTTKRPGKFWRTIGLEWLPRLLNEPRRLWRRSVISMPLFIGDVFKEKIRLIKNKSVG